MESADHPNSRNPIRTNPLRTRDDLRLAFDQLSLPLQPFYSEGAARIELGDTGTSYSPSVAGMEGFSRVLWGMVPLLAGGGDSELWATCLRGIVSGTNPEHEEYWGDIRDYDQRLVEMASFGFALATIPEKIWEPLSDEERERLYRWLNQINGHPVWDCNWLFFRVLVNIGFRRIGRPYDKEQLVRNLNRIDEFYAGEGWFTDGIGGHADYYGPFAIHYYGLLYAKLMREEDPERSARFRERSALFARSFIHWFADDGSALPYGRSMAYRFAQAAFWSAYAYADAGADSGANAIPAGVVKGIVLRHLRWWFRQPIFDAAGVLTIGYRYPSLVIAEQYNSPGSPYWALKTFLPLALAKDHPFWSAEELPLPDLDALSVQKPADLVLVRRKETDHVAAFNAGHAGTNEHAHTSAKYEKFAYSTAFGFSVPKAEWGVAQGAFDSTLALSERDNLFRVRRCNEETRIDGRLLYSRWKPWADVEVRTWIVAGLPRHLRIHRIDSARPLDVAEGGFALGLQDDTLALAEGAKAVASGALGTSAIVSHAGFERAEAVHAQPNTNVLHPRTVIPTLRGSLEPGIHWLVAEVYGEPGGRQDPGSPAFVATIGENRIDIVEDGGERFTVLF